MLDAGPSQVTRKWVSSTWTVTIFPGLGGADAESLAGDHDDAVAGDLALDALTWPGNGRWRAAARGAPRSLPWSAAGTGWQGRILARIPPLMTWTRWPCRLKGDPAAVDLDDGAGQYLARAGRFGVAQLQCGRVVGVQVGRDGLDELAADEHAQVNSSAHMRPSCAVRAAPILIRRIS
jgi:hypothetical protein